MNKIKQTIYRYMQMQMKLKWKINEKKEVGACKAI